MTDLTQAINVHDFMSDHGRALSVGDEGGQYVTKEDGREIYWSVDLGKQRDLLIDYCRQRSAGNHLEIYELCSDQGPLKETLTLRYELEADDEGSWESYSTMFLLKIAAILQEVAAACYILEFLASQSVVVVLEAEPLIEVIDGVQYSTNVVRLQFPYICTRYDFYYQTVRPILIKHLTRENVMSLLDRQPQGDWNTILASPHPRMEPLYGASLYQGGPVLEVTHIWSSVDPDSIMSVGVEHECSIHPSELFSAKYHRHLEHDEGLELFDVDEAQELEASELDQYYAVYYPIYFSEYYFCNTAPVRSDCITRNRREGFDLISFVSKCQGDTRIDAYRLCEDMLSLIKPSRYYNKSNWMNIGAALANAALTNKADSRGELGLTKWQRCTLTAVSSGTMPSFMTEMGSFQETTRQYYLTIGKRLVTFKTLARYAMADSPQEYANWERSWVITGLLGTITQYEVDIARGVWRTMFMDHLVTDSGKWMSFVGNHWVPDYNRVELRRGLVAASDRINDLCREIDLKARDHSDAKAREVALAKRDGLLKVFSALRGSKLPKITSNCDLDFLVRDADRMFDTNRAVMGVANGVIELGATDVTFRSGLAEDFVRKVSPTAYRMDYNWETPMVKKFLNWTHQLFPDDEVHRYAMKFYSSCLLKGNRDKVLLVALGDTDAGKSTWHRCLEEMFGPDLWFKYPRDFLAPGGAKKGSGPNPEEAQADGAHVGVVDELPKVLDNEKVKAKVGGTDTTYSRNCNENGSKKDSTAKLIINANQFEIKGLDKAGMGRLSILPFSAKYSADAPKSVEEQKRKNHYPINRYFDEELPNMCQAALWVLIQYYPLYRQEGLIRPAIMRQLVKDHVARHDPYTHYFLDRIKRALPIGITDEDEINDSNRHLLPKLLVGTAYNDFKLWYPTLYPSNRLPDVTTFINSMKRDDLLGNDDKGVWYGYELVVDDTQGSSNTDFGDENQFY